MILLDTQSLVWFFEGVDALGRKARTVIDESDRACSAISFWELAMLVDKNRVALSKPLNLWTATLIHEGDVLVLPVTGEIALDAGSLPHGIHGDPADRIVVATARSLGCQLMTADRKILAYAAAGHVQAIDARR